MSELISVLANRDNYYRFKPFIKDHAVPKETRVILKDLDEYYTMNPSIDDIDIDSFRTWFLILKHSKLKPEQAEIYHEIFDNVESVLKSATPIDNTDIVESFIERDYATRIADVSLKVAEGDDKASIMECEVLLDEYRNESQRAATNTEEALVQNDLTELFDDTLSPGLDWSMDALNRSLGPLRKGDLVVVGKLPEAGGTAFAVSQAAHMLQMMPADQCVLYFGNEERGNALHKRVVYSLTNKNKDEVNKDVVKTADEYQHLRGDDFKIFSVHGMALRTIERYIKHYNPGLIVFDQLYKVQGNDKEGEVQKIKKLFEGARKIAAEYAPVIAVHQCDGTAYNSVYAGMEQLYMSRIGIQGEADAIITIGTSTEPGNETKRYINIPKNKLDGGPHSAEMYRHSKWEVVIDAERTRYYG